MDYLELQGYLSKIAESETLDILREHVSRLLNTLGFNHFACVSHVDRAFRPDGAADLHNYPKPWEAHFTENHLEKIDPVQRYARRTILPFHWNDHKFLQTMKREQLLILQEATAFGLANGYTVPLHGPGQYSASFSVSPGKNKIAPSAFQAVHLIAPFVYEKARRLAKPQKPKGINSKQLSPRELQCLELAARGKSDWVISELLSLSENTVHSYFESAKKRLGVATRTQAIVRAMYDAQISIHQIGKTL
ncbi:MAG: LuxR family transcriptional regulator [Sphingomonadales bacterium]